MVRDAQAHGERLAGGSARGGIGVRDGAAASGINLRAMRRGGFMTFRLQLLRGAEATVGFAFGEQAVGVLAINPEALRLPVRRVWAFDAGALVPVEAEPQQILHELGFVAHLAAVEVGVFDAQQEGSARMSREEPVVERGARISYVKKAGRRGCEANTRQFVRHDRSQVRSYGSSRRATTFQRKRTKLGGLFGSNR